MEWSVLNWNNITFDQGFPAGNYNAEIYINDKLAQTVNFSVK